MLRVVVAFFGIAVLAAAAAWFADRPGELTISWMGYEVQTSFMLAVAALMATVFVLTVIGVLLRGLIGMPGAISGFFRSRRQMRGLEALTKGVVAAGAGDAAAATRYSAQASRILTNEPLAHLLKAQAAQLSGDKVTVKRVFEAMLQDTETETLGLRGLFVQARQDGDFDKARRYAERAFAISPRLTWAARAVLAVQSSEADWTAAEATVDLCRRNKLFEADEATRKKAVVNTAQAAELEDRMPDRALELALTAHKAAPDLVPAAVIAGRLLAATGQTRKAGRVLEKTWRLSPHPDIAEIYGAARPGSSPRDRFKRVKALVKKLPAPVEGPIALARSAIAANDWPQARAALEPLIANRPSARVCTLMAEIEEGETGDEGRMREWLSRAVSAPRDPVWTADGYTSDTWRAFSPVSGELDAFEWKVAVEGLQYLGSVEDAPGETAAEQHSLPVQTDPPEPETAPLPEVEEATDTVTAEVVAEPEVDAPVPDAEPAAEADGADAPEPEPAADKPADRRLDKAPKKPVIFVPPRPPDDPGPAPRDDPQGNMFQALFAR